MPKPDQKFEYILDETTYHTEKALHSANEETCIEAQHEWQKSFAYGRYSCKKCEAKRMKIK